MRIRLSTAVVPLILIALSVPASARVLFVKGGGSGDGSSWSAPLGTVQAALDAASSGDEVWVCEGTYTGGVTLRNSVALYGGFAGTEERRDERDWISHLTVLDGENQRTVVSASSLSEEAVLDGFIVRNGDGSFGRESYFGPFSMGGGLFADYSRLRITHNVFENNTAAGIGGGICLIGGSYTIDRNTFRGNTVTQPPADWRIGYAGSALRAFQEEAETLWVTMTNNVFTGNSSMGWDANSYKAAIVDCDWGTFVFEGNEVHDNEGAVTLDGAPATVRNNTVHNNFGGIGCKSPTDTTLIEGNRITNSRGGISLDGAGTIRGNIVTENSTGGIFVYPWNGGTITVENNLIARNSAADGGGLYAEGGGTYGGSVRAVNNTVVGNTGTSTGAGAIHCRDFDTDRVFLFNNTVVFNSSGVAIEQSSSSLATIHNNNVYGNLNGNYIVTPDPTGTNGNISEDPLFVDRADEDYRLLSGSPCIDTGGDAYVSAGGVDLDGKPRILGAHVDIGAYEFLPGGPFTWAEALQALKAAGGLAGATPEAALRLNVVGGTPERVDMLDAARLARKAAGLEANP